MIILIMAIFAILAFWANMVMKKPILRYLVTIIMFAGLVVSVTAIVANMHDHYGMKTETTTVKKEIYSAGPAEQTFGVLLYQGVGSDGKENAYIYKASATASRVTVSKPDLKTSSRQVSVSGNKAYRIVKTTRYVYKTDLYRLLFGIADNDHQLKNYHIVYQVPDTWVAMTPEQAKALPAKMTPKSAEEKAAMAMQQQQLAALAKTDPDKAASLQAQQVKKILNNQK